MANRFIPACAGNAVAGSASAARAAVHPRVCGERCHTVARKPLGIGSSPRVRGTRWCMPPPPSPDRFIPACAGNAVGACTSTRAPPVHPRVCGERVLVVGVGVGVLGSSPRVRGTLTRERTTPGTSRFIPACAGNAARRWRRRSAGTVHPRVCGEREPRSRAARGKSGSSPRVRGTPACPLTPGDPSRFIPACAGNAAAR